MATIPAAIVASDKLNRGGGDDCASSGRLSTPVRPEFFFFLPTTFALPGSMRDRTLDPGNLQTEDPATMGLLSDGAADTISRHRNPLCDPRTSEKVALADMLSIYIS